MGRSVGEFEVVAALPDAVVVVFAAITTLADTWFVFALLAGLYWFLPASYVRSPRRSAATLVALATCTLAFVTLIKIGVGVPRPPAAATPAAVPDWLPGALVGWFESTTGSGGFGFPSGHAAGATVTYVGLAVLVDRWDRTARLVVGATVAAAVGLSRIVIELHYLVDFLAGTALALVVLVGGLRLAGDDGFGTGDRGSLDPTPVFLAAAAVSTAAVVVAFVTGHPGEVLNGAVGVGTGLGGALGWRYCTGDEPPVPLRVAVPGLAVTGALWLGVLAVEPAWPVAIAMTTLGTAGVVAMPAVGTRWGSVR